MAARLALLLLIAVSFWTAAPRTAPQDPLQLAFDRYAAGAYADALAGLDHRLTAGALRTAGERWIAAGDAVSRPRRERVAAAFALEAVWVATRRAEHVLWDFEWHPLRPMPWDAPLSDMKAVVPVVGWGCEVISKSPITHHADAVWYLASVAVVQDVRASPALTGWTFIQETRKTSDPLMVRERSDGHLSHARARAPAEPRWRMAEALARADRHSSPFERRGVLRNAPGRPDLRQVAVTLEALTAEAALAGEARLRIALIDLYRRRWAEALDQVERARPLLTEPFLIALADYFSGWAFEQTGRPADAIAAYRAALTRAPGMRNISTLLATQLFLVNERSEAYSILEENYRPRPEPLDIVDLFERGDARLVPQYFAQMRDALR